MYSQGELRSKRGGPGVQRVQKTYADQLLYSLVSERNTLNFGMILRYGDIALAEFTDYRHTGPFSQHRYRRIADRADGVLTGRSGWLADRAQPRSA